MPIVALKPGYCGTVADTEDRFHGKRLIYVCWDQHLLFSAPLCIPLPPDMPFGALIDTVLPGAYGSHPDFAQIDWQEVQWFESGRPFTPDPSRSLADNGLVHKTVIRFRTPGLNGLQGSYS